VVGAVSLLYLDFETRSELDLKKVGVHAYAHHSSTEIACTGWALDDGEVQVESGLPDAVRVAAYDEMEPLPTIVAHNAMMEREMLHAKLGVLLPWSCFIDTAALAARMALPRKLERVAEALRLDEQKDMAGHRVMMKLARPKKRASEDEDAEFWDEEEKPEDFQALREYCRQDVAVMREIHRRLLPLSAGEQRLYELTGKMNDRGVAVDLESVPKALDILDLATREEMAEFARLTGGSTPKSYVRVAKALGLPNTKKPTIRNAMRHGFVETKVEVEPDVWKVRRYPEVGTFPKTVIRACELFKKLARSSPAKLRAMQLRASRDKRVRGVLIYSGAERTQRWSSGGIQMHNFPRGLGGPNKKNGFRCPTTTAFDALKQGCLDLLYADVPATIAEMLRGFITGPVLVGDYAQIEARTLNWLSGQQDIVDLFAADKDVYCYTASAIYGRPIDKTSTDPNLPPGVDPRFIGKTTELGAGYGLGWMKFQRQLDDVFDVQIESEFAMRIISTYRQTHRHVVAWWEKLQKGFEYAVARDVARVQVDERIAMGNVRVGGLRYAYIELPSGRRLYYAEPEMTAEGVRYWGRNIYKGGKWDRVHTYGGKIAENITQATSRDILALAMVNLDDAGFPLILQVHDEVVCEADGHHLLNDMKNIMLVSPSWAAGLPIDVEVFESQRYRK
jgi:DNA polymerase